MIVLPPPGSVLVIITNHQTSHFFTGFIRDPGLHWKSRANSWIDMMRKLIIFATSIVTWLLEKGPWTLNIPGEWTPVLILFSRALSLYLEHQVLAALIQNIWTRRNLSSWLWLALYISLAFWHLTVTLCLLMLTEMQRQATFTKEKGCN